MNNNKATHGLLADDFRSPDMPSSPYNKQSRGGTPDVRYLPVSHQTTKDGTYNRVPNIETGGYPSPAFSSPGLSSLASPGTFKSLEEVKHFNDMKASDALLKRRIRRLKFLLRLATLLLALYMTATMAATFHKFFTTRNTLISVPDPAANGAPRPRGPWAKQTKTWPTTVLLVTSALSFTISAFVMAAYIRGVSAANTIYEWGSWGGAAIFGTHVGMWIAVAVAYRAGKDGEDLWGWTCDERAMRIQEPFARVINFKRYCDVQTSSWYTSIAQAGVMVLSVMVYAWGYRRLRQQRVMEERFGEEAGYVHRESRWSRLVPTKR